MTLISMSLTTTNHALSVRKSSHLVAKCLLVVLLVVTQLAVRTDAIITSTTVTLITDTTATITVTYDATPTAGSVSYTVNGVAGPAVTTPTSINLVNLTPCFANAIVITQTGAPAYPAVTVNTLPGKVTGTTATSPLAGTITVSWSAPATVASTYCPYWIAINVATSGTTTVLWNQQVTATTTTATFYDIPAGNYDVFVYATTPTLTSPANTAVTVTVAAYTTTLATTTATTTPSGGQFIVTFNGVVFTTGLQQVVYQTSHSVVGSAAYTTVAVPLCQGLTTVVATNSTLNGAFERCYVSGFTNGTLIGTSVLVFTRSKLPTFDVNSLKTTATSLLTSASANVAYYYAHATSPVTVTVTINFAARLLETNIFTTALIVSLVILLQLKSTNVNLV